MGSVYVDKKALRARDFWASIVLFGVSLFFLLQTAELPFLEAASAGVDSARWFNSAALVPFGIFGSLFILSIVLFAIAVRDGGAAQAFSMVGLELERVEMARLALITIILLSYLFGLVPRVDFVISSALTMTALIWGFHRGVRSATVLSATAVLVPALYALIVNFERSSWSKPHDDDWMTLGAWVVLTLLMFGVEIRRGNADAIVRLTPMISWVCPLLLVLTMAFGFRQNVPNRAGLLFQKIEYHYYVTVRPLWQRQ